MKSRLSLIFATLVVLLGSMVWVVQDRRSSSAVPAMIAAPDNTVVVTAAPERNVAAPEATAVVVPVVSATAALSTAVSPTPPTVHVSPSGDVQYTARDGDTVSQLAIALLGSDSRAHRDAIIKANPVLQANPDRVLAGETYSATPAPVQVAVEENNTTVPAIPPVEGTSEISNAPEMKYVARAGDTVAGLAGNLLGADTKSNRNSIIAGNTSLQQDPDHLVAGQSYTIEAPNGLAANSATAVSKAATTQPDADDVLVGAGRHLRYTAKAGDTVSRLAQMLLGEDTVQNRDVIINGNPSLKRDPDHLVAGQTYWIAAPTADATPR